MKQILITFVMCGCTLVHTSGQVSLGLRLGYSPSTDPGTHALMVNRNNPAQESMFNADRVSFSPQVGLAARKDIGRYWFMTELNYGRVKTTYSLAPTHRYAEGGQIATHYDIKQDVLELPLTAGVNLGIVDVFSGVFLNTDLHRQNGMDGMDGYRYDAPAFRPGWHAGIGMNYHKFLLELRYHQEFDGYGEGQFLDGEELLLHNSPRRLILTAGYQF
jgi:hypothetical protein